MNAILLVIDSLDYTRCQHSSSELLPNIKRRAKDGISCENMFSQAPYTEAATIALYCGQNTLDYHGYIERFNNAENTLMECVRNAGYETFFNCFQPQCFPSSLRRGVDYIMYNRGFDNPSLWTYRFEYYTEKYKKGDFVERDYSQLIRILADNFDEWVRFLDDLLKDDISVAMIKKLNSSYNATVVKKAVLEEKKIFENDPNAYILEIFQKGKNHSLFSIPYFDQIDYEISDNVEHYYNNEIRAFVRKTRRMNMSYNILFNNDIITAGLKALKYYIAGDTDSYTQESALIRNALLMGNNNKKYGSTCHSLKGQPSFNEHIKTFTEWLDTRKDKSKPFFATIHVDDIHYPEMYFSYDSDDMSLLEEELNTAKDCLKSRKVSEKGTISLDLSLRYADLKFEQLMQALEERGIIDDTIVFVTADHGFSYSGYPIRYKFVNTFYLENFKIPFFIIGKDIKKISEMALRSSTDIPPTICDVLGIDKPHSFVGDSVLKSINEDRILTIEYCGGGCPDIDDKQLMIAAFDKDFMVAGLFKLKEGFEKHNVTEIYNLRKDPLQKKNLVNKMEMGLLNKYLKRIKDRVRNIQKTNEYIIKSF